jgi:tRNA(fMet)-specific endonuclease VapC
VRYLLDTNSLSYFFRGEGAIAARLTAHVPADIGLPAPVLYESRYGILKLTQGARQSSLLQALERVRQSIDVVPFDDVAAESAARIRAQLEALGVGIGPIDILIAGIAVAQSATLVTRNTREFSRNNGLLLENWYDA